MRKRVGTFYIKESFLKKKYHFDFKKSNLSIDISTSDCVNKRLINKKREARKYSEQTSTNSNCFEQAE